MYLVLFDEISEDEANSNPKVVKVKRWLSPHHWTMMMTYQLYPPTPWNTWQRSQAPLPQFIVGEGLPFASLHPERNTSFHRLRRSQKVLTASRFLRLQEQLSSMERCFERLKILSQRLTHFFSTKSGVKRRMEPNQATKQTQGLFQHQGRRQREIWGLGGRTES